jgi:hypothetical protein
MEPQLLHHLKGHNPIRDHYPASEASWRVPVVNFAGLLGMAGGGWTAGFFYDQFASYGIAFAAGLGFNILNLIVIVPLVTRDRPALRLAAG